MARAVQALITAAHHSVNDALMSGLEVACDKLSGRDSAMAAEFLAKLHKGWTLSPAQLKWANDLCQRATPKPVTNDNGREKIDVGDFSAMIDLFDKAAAKRKSPPKVLLSCGKGEIQLSVAGNSAREPGTINVSTPGGYGNSTWYGRITKEGKFEVSPREKTPADLMPTLRDFAADPLKAMVKYGRLLGRCSICARTLSDPESVERGIGPICAARLGF